MNEMEKTSGEMRILGILMLTTNSGLFFIFPPKFWRCGKAAVYGMEITLEWSLAG